MDRVTSISILRANPGIREAIVLQMDKLKITMTEICAEFEAAGHKMTKQAFSKYLNHGAIVGSITEYQIALLCSYLNIKVAMYGEPGPVITDKKERIQKLKEYTKWLNELSGRSLTSLKKGRSLPTPLGRRGMGSSKPQSPSELE